jgi:Zn-dependent peptidase ImmA (M78 family)
MYRYETRNFTVYKKSTGNKATKQEQLAVDDEPCMFLIQQKQDERREKKASRADLSRPAR